MLPGQRFCCDRWGRKSAVDNPMILNHTSNSWQHVTTTRGDLWADFRDHANIGRALPACGRMLMFCPKPGEINVVNLERKCSSSIAMAIAAMADAMLLPSRLTELPRSRRPRSDLGLAQLRCWRPWPSKRSRWFSHQTSSNHIKIQNKCQPYPAWIAWHRRELPATELQQIQREIEKSVERLIGKRPAVRSIRKPLRSVMYSQV